MNIGYIIKGERKKKNLTQKELAEKINKSERMIQKYENGEVTPSIDIITKIADELNVDIIELITGKSFKELMNSDGLLQDTIKDMDKEEASKLLERISIKGDIELYKNKREITITEAKLELLKCIETLFLNKLAPPFRHEKYIEHEFIEIYDNTLSMIDNKVNKIEQHFKDYDTSEIKRINEKIKSESEDKTDK